MTVLALRASSSNVTLRSARSASQPTRRARSTARVRQAAPALDARAVALARRWGVVRPNGSARRRPLRRATPDEAGCARGSAWLRPLSRGWVVLTPDAGWTPARFTGGRAPLRGFDGRGLRPPPGSGAGAPETAGAVSARRLPRPGPGRAGARRVLRAGGETPGGWRLRARSPGFAWARRPLRGGGHGAVRGTEVLLGVDCYCEGRYSFGKP